MDTANAANPWFWFAKEDFAARRANIAQEIGPGACAVLQGAPTPKGFEVFRQSNEFFYLTGLELAGCFLVLDGDTRKSNLYAPHRDPHACGGVSALGVEDAQALIDLTAVDDVRAAEDLAADLKDKKAVATPHMPAENRLQARDSLQIAAKIAAADPWDGLPTREQRFIERLRQTATNAEIRDLTPILDEMRRIKSPKELAVLRRAGKLSALAVKEAMKCAKPGGNEAELCALAEFVFQANGAKGSGYRPIIPNGENVWYGHYGFNDKPLKDGQLVLMDCAPDMCYYTSDIGRMFPVSGRYSPLQRELYGFMVEYHKTILALLKPGVMPADVAAAAAEKMTPVVENTKWSKPIYEEAVRRTLTFRGHLSHPVGMAVHDVGRYYEREFPVGLVITVDPQMWVPEERLYIRVEDTVAITEAGVEILTKDAPLELDDVETAMREPGIFDKISVSLPN